MFEAFIFPCFNFAFAANVATFLFKLALSMNIVIAELSTNSGKNLL